MIANLLNDIVLLHTLAKDVMRSMSRLYSVWSHLFPRSIHGISGIFALISASHLFVASRVFGRVISKTIMAPTVSEIQSAREKQKTRTQHISLPIPL